MKDQSNKTNKDLKGRVEFGIEFGNVNQKEQKHKKKDSSKKER